MARTKPAAAAAGDEAAHDGSSPTATSLLSLSDALLFATLCIVGLPVEVQVKDGSLYSGIFHTASLDKGYGVVLKKARKIGAGKCDSNLPLGAFVDTLVVLAGDLVQVFVKDCLLPVEGAVGGISGCDAEVTKPQTCVNDTSREARSLVSDNAPQLSKLGQNKVERIPFYPCENVDTEVDVAKKALENIDQVRDAGHASKCLVKDRKAEEHQSNTTTTTTTKSLGRQVVKCSDLSEEHELSIAETQLQDVRGSSNDNQSASLGLTARKLTSGKPSAKGSKLNPSAKIFSPSFASFRPALAAAPAVVNPSHMSNSISQVPNASASAFGINTLSGRSFLSSKAVQFNNLDSGMSGIAAQYTHPAIGHDITRLVPARVGVQYQPIQGGPTYSNPNSHSVLAARFNPLVCVHPISQDAISGTPVISQGWSGPMMHPYQANIQKFQGAAQLYVAPPIITGGNQPLVAPSPATFAQPFPSIRPIIIPVANGILASKFQ